MADPIDIRTVCVDHIDNILDDFAFKHKDNSFLGFSVVVQFIRDTVSTCDKCNCPARWALAYPVQPILEE